MEGGNSGATQLALNTIWYKLCHPRITLWWAPAFTTSSAATRYCNSKTGDLCCKKSVFIRSRWITRAEQIKAVNVEDRCVIQVEYMFFLTQLPRHTDLTWGLSQCCTGEWHDTKLQCVMFGMFAGAGADMCIRVISQGNNSSVISQDYTCSSPTSNTALNSQFEFSEQNVPKLYSSIQYTILHFWVI